MKTHLLILAGALLLAGCQSDERPPIRTKDLVGQGGDRLLVYTDPETGCEYIRLPGTGTSPSITLRYTRAGKPMCPEVP